MVMAKLTLLRFRNKLPGLEVHETIVGYGHENVLATHRSTIEFTKEAHLSRNGDCILIVSIDKGINDLSKEFKQALRNNNAELTILIEVGNIVEEIHAQGSSQLRLNDATEMVIRKSDHISERTLAISADKAAKDVSREIVEMLKNPNQQAKITFIVKKRNEKLLDETIQGAPIY